MDRREAPPTEEGWFALHDFRRVDWDAWRAAPERDREQALEEGRAFLEDAESVADAEAGTSVTYAVLGHKADLGMVHLRPSMAALDALERRFERTAFAEFTERAHSFVSVTEVSGYTMDAQGFFEDGLDAIEDAGLRNYIGTRLRPTIPDAAYMCFYPMNKRRDPEYNWYDLPFEERAEHMRAHGEIGREYAGRVTQVVTGSIALDDYEWGVTLFGEDPTAFKDLLYEMRFDPSTSRFAEFGSFYTGRRLEPDRLDAYLAGEALDADAPDGIDAERDPEEGTSPHGATPQGTDGDADLRGELAELNIYAGQPHGEDVHALVLYSEADPETLFEEVQGVRANFDHYDTHVKTAVYDAEGRDRTAVVSIWETQRAAETAGGFLSDLPGVVSRAGEESGFGTMGMFYTVKPEHREAFVERFDEVTGLLGDMEGHLETDLMLNLEDENDMFIASQWTAREDAMGFFRSEDFRETVQWGRDVLADRPRHVFLA